MADRVVLAKDIRVHLIRLESQRSVRPLVTAPVEKLPDNLWDIEAVLRHCFPDASGDVIKSAVDRLEEIQWQYADNREYEIAAGDDL